MEPSAAGDASATARKRISTACEACRATKIKCQPSEQPGVCRKCLDSKKECISRTGPRTRRRRTKLVGDGQPIPQLPPTAGPSKTFTIDFEVPSQPEVDENFDALRDSHAQFIDTMFPSDTQDVFPPSPTGIPTPPSSHSHSILSLHAKPQFNLDSAESLLISFRTMLPHFPCIILEPDDTVATLAATRPFVLLAILAAASGSRTLQGHNLYDEEFRKVLALKFVAGGERSIELLQGMLIYCAWYPFHLRPKNKHAYQYVRMARDLTHDLELDQESSDMAGNQVSGEQLEKVRTYLACYCSLSKWVLSCYRNFAAHNHSHMYSFKRMDVVAKFTPWTAQCCDMLQRHAEVDGDFTLSYLVQLTNFTLTAKEAICDSTAPTDQQSQLVLYGLEAQRKELCLSMLPHIASTAPVKLAEHFLDVFLNGGPLLNPMRTKHRPTGCILPSTPKLRLCVQAIRAFLELVTGMGQATFAAFTSNNWAQFVICTVLAVRLSFPMSEVPDWDDGWARSELQFSKFLAHMCDGEDLTAVNTRVDALSAGRVVLRVVKDKYTRRVAMHTKAAAEVTPGSAHGCPMFDRDMEQYINSWDFDVSSVVVPPPDEMHPQQPVFHDLWATMTMGWANDMPEEASMMP